MNASGDIYATGATDGDLPATSGAYQTTVQGSHAVFLAELNPAGNGANDLLFCTYLGCSGGLSGGFSLALGPGGNVYLAGTAYAGMPVTPGAYQSASTNVNNPFSPYVAVFNSTGSSLLYCTYVGYFYCNGLAVDSSGAAYITGYTGTGFPTTPGAFQPTANLGDDCFVSKIVPAGNGAADLAYSTYLGGSGGTDVGMAIAVDAAGRAYVVGYTDDSNFPTTPGAYQTSKTTSADDGFLTQLNPTGTGLLYSTYFSGSSWDSDPAGVALGSDGGVYMVGFAGSNFPITPGVFQPNYGGGYLTGFVTKFDSSIFSIPTPNTTLTSTPTNTNTPTPMNTPTDTFSPTPTNTPTGTYTPMDTSTPTNTPTPTPTPTTTFTLTITYTLTPTFTALPSCSEFSISKNAFFPSNGPVSIYVSYCQYPGDFSLGIYNSAGEHIKTLDSRHLEGPISAFYLWDGRNKYGDPCASGVYILYLVEPYNRQIKRILLLK